MPEKLTDFGFKKVPVAEKAARVADVFHSVAGKYDVMNDVMSLGTHRLMKRYAVEMTAVRPGNRVLDLAGGTGDLAALIAPLVGDGSIVLCDINHSMLEQGRDRLIDEGVSATIEYTRADAESLPFADNSFDVITIAFGLRNVTDKAAALRSMHRVLAPGGRLVILEFSKPRNPLLKSAYRAYQGLWPRLGKLVADDSESYRYLVESIEMHPSQEELLAMIEEAGFVDCRFHDLADGITAIHFGRKQAQ